MKLLGALVLVVLAVFPGLVLGQLNTRAGDAITSLLLLTLAVLLLVASVRDNVARWYRVTSSIAGGAATLLWLNWTGLMSLRWLAGS